VKHRTVICMLDGAVWRGTVETAPRETAAAQMLGDNKQLYFESTDGDQRGMVEMDSVKAIYVGDEMESVLQSSPRFFDCAPIPSSLWVRTHFVDGEIVEGMIANAWAAFSGDLLELRVPGQQVDHKQVLIPRTSIADLQVIATR
jgi:hypothetical protein